MKFEKGLLFTGILLVAGIGAVSCGSSQSVEPAAVIDAEKTGPWALVRDQSGLSFITTKNNSVAEIGTFTAFDGSVSTDGTAEFTIVVDSINTNNDVRDPRMRQYLFETNNHPYITVKTDLALDGFTEMNIGDRKTVFLSYNLGIRGEGSARESYVMVTRLGANKILVENKAPVLVEASDFGLEGGVEKLRELANLTSISPVVPVTFSLVFERE